MVLEANCQQIVKKATPFVINVRSSLVVDSHRRNELALYRYGVSCS